MDIINIKFATYNLRFGQTPYNYLFNMWLDCVKFRGCKSDFWVFVLQHYKYHIYGHKKYHEIKEQRASLKITRLLRVSSVKTI